MSVPSVLLLLLPQHSLSGGEPGAGRDRRPAAAAAVVAGSVAHGPAERTHTVAEPRRPASPRCRRACDRRIKGGLAAEAGRGGRSGKGVALPRRDPGGADGDAQEARKKDANYVLPRVAVQILALPSPRAGPSQRSPRHTERPLPPPKRRLSLAGRRRGTRRAPRAPPRARPVWPLGCGNGGTPWTPAARATDEGQRRRTGGGRAGGKGGAHSPRFARVHLGARQRACLTGTRDLQVAPTPPPGGGASCVRRGRVAGARCGRAPRCASAHVRGCGRGVWKGASKGGDKSRWDMCGS